MAKKKAAHGGGHGWFVTFADLMALQDMPEISELSKHVMIEETPQGLNIEIVDQDGRSMFPDGSKEPYERTRRLIQKLAAQFKAMPYRISVSGHTAASRVPAKPGYGSWD